MAVSPSAAASSAPDASHSSSENLASTFDELRAALDEHGVEAALERLADRLRAEGRFHELFDARLVEARHRLGLPVILTTGLDDLAEPIRTQMEDAYLAACRETGRLLLDAGRVREAWMYLRPAGERAEVADALERLHKQGEPYEPLLEIALHEGVHPRLGFELVLEHYGVCNAITTFDGQMHARPKKEKQEVAALLVRRLHRDLLASLKADAARREGKEPTGETIFDVVASRPELFENDNYHIDTSHLSAIVRFALYIDDPEVLRLALDLTEYGRRLSPQYQYPGSDPFTETYPSHALFLGALLGEKVDEAVDYFRARAEAAVQEGRQSAAPEVYVGLLARVGRQREAFEAAATLIPAGAQTGGFAPTLLELARQAGSYQGLMDVCRERGDLVGYAMGLVEGRAQGAV